MLFDCGGRTPARKCTKPYHPIAAKLMLQSQISLLRIRCFHVRIENIQSWLRRRRPSRQLHTLRKSARREVAALSQICFQFADIR
jgi:hypothetical protein